VIGVRSTSRTSSANAAFQFQSSATSAPPSREVHALVRVLAVVDEQVDPTEPFEQRRELVLAATDGQAPALAQRAGDHPAGLLAGWDRGPLLPLPERPGLVVGADDLREVDRVQLAGAVPLEREEQERGREAVADAGLHRHARP